MDHSDNSDNNCCDTCNHGYYANPETADITSASFDRYSQWLRLRSGLIQKGLSPGRLTALHLLRFTLAKT